jgi:hypothetical protein
MSARAKAIAPLAIVIGIISFLWTELSLNFTFNWVTTDAVYAGFGVPTNFHLILPVAFITYGLFFAAGGDNAAFGKIFLATVFGSVAALVTMPLAFSTADAKTAEIIAGEDVGPAYWGIALWVGIFAFILVMILVAGDWYYVAGTFPCFAAVFLWWIATGLDGYVPAAVTTADGTEIPISGSGFSDSEIAANIAANGGLGTPGGTGVAGGLLSTPWYWVWFSTWVTLVCGCILGIVTSKIVAAVTPKPKAAAAEA